MATGLKRDLLRWLLSLNLSYPIKNPRRDFSNGFLVAEIFSKYFSTEIAMHSFDATATNADRKRDNWTLLEKFCKKHRFVLSKQEIEAVIACEETAIGPLLERVFHFCVENRADRAATAPSPPALPRVALIAANKPSTSYAAQAPAAAAAAQPVSAPVQRRQRPPPQAFPTLDAPPPPPHGADSYYGGSPSPPGGDPYFRPLPPSYGGVVPLPEPAGPLPPGYGLGVGAGVGAAAGAGAGGAHYYQQLNFQQSLAAAAAAGNGGLSGGYPLSPDSPAVGPPLWGGPPAAQQPPQQQQQQPAAAAARPPPAMPSRTVKTAPKGPASRQQSAAGPGPASRGARAPASSSSATRLGAQAAASAAAAAAAAAAVPAPPLYVPPAAAAEPPPPARRPPPVLLELDDPDPADALISWTVAPPGGGGAPPPTQQRPAARPTGTANGGGYAAQAAGGSRGSAAGNSRGDACTSPPGRRKALLQDYQPYTEKDYKKLGPVELGRLGPDLETDELRAKREQREKALEYSRIAKAVNREILKDAKPKEPPPKPITSRQKALEFAKNIPKPAQPAPKEQGGTPADEMLARLGIRDPIFDELEELEREHREAKQKVQALVRGR